MYPSKGFKAGSAFHKNFAEDLDSEEDDTDPAYKNGMKKSAANCKYSKSILEIIKDDDEGEKMRTSSMDIQVNEEVQMFLRRIDLEFLIEYFNGSHSKTTLRDMYEMNDDNLEELLNGALYVKRIRSELQRRFESNSYYDSHRSSLTQRTSTHEIWIWNLVRNSL